MRFLTIFRPESGVEGAAPSPEHMAEMGRYVEQEMQAGRLVTTEPLTPRAQCARVRLTGGAFTVDEETVRAGGYAILNAASKEEAVAQCKAFLKLVGDGAVELRQILEFTPPAA